MMPGDRVRYVPGHAEGNATHPDCEDGTVSSIGQTCVRVRFDKHVERFGWDGATALACTPDDLIVLPSQDGDATPEVTRISCDTLQRQQ